MNSLGNAHLQNARNSAHNRAVSLPAFSLAAAQQAQSQQQQHGSAGGFGGLGSGLGGFGAVGGGYGLGVSGDGGLPGWAEEEVA
jgi:hypothetical protein